MAAVAEIILRAVDRTKGAFQSVKNELRGLDKVAQKAFGFGGLEKLGKIATVVAITRKLVGDLSEYARIARDTGDRRIVNDDDLRALDSMGGKWRDIKSTVASITAQFAQWIGIGLDKIGLSGSMSEAEDYQDRVSKQQEKNIADIKGRINEVRKAQQDAADAEKKLNESRMTDEQLLAERKKDLTRNMTERPGTRLGEAQRDKARYELLLEIQKLEDKIAEDKARSDKEAKDAEQEKADEAKKAAKELADKAKKQADEAKRRAEQERDRIVSAMGANLQRSIVMGEAVRSMGGAASRRVSLASRDPQQTEIVRLLRQIADNLKVPK